EKRETQARLNGTGGAGDGEVIDLHPNLSKIYMKKIDSLQELVNSGTELRQAAGAMLRALADRIVITPDREKNELGVETHGRIAAIMNFITGKDPATATPAPSMGVVVVARGRFKQRPQKSAA